jgi:hypothetical protein
MATEENRRGFAWIGWLVLLGLVAWQLYLGTTIQELGIPGLLTVKFHDAPPPPPPPARMSATEEGFDRWGSDYKDFVASDVEECLRECIADARCKAISFNRDSRQCWMKNSHALRQDNRGFISAVKLGD